MKLGFSLSNNQGIEDVQFVVQLATLAEELGFDSVWASDHVFNTGHVLERMGSGWHPTALPPEELSQGMRYLEEQAESAGRDPSEIQVSVSAPMGSAREGRFSLGTEPGEILRKVQAYEGLGVDRMVISSNTRDAQDLLPAMEMLAREVLPAFQ